MLLQNLHHQSIEMQVAAVAVMSTTHRSKGYPLYAASTITRARWDILILPMMLIQAQAHTITLQ